MIEERETGEDEHRDEDQDVENEEMVEGLKEEIERLRRIIEERESQHGDDEHEKSAEKVETASNDNDVKQNTNKQNETQIGHPDEKVQLHNDDDEKNHEMKETEQAKMRTFPLDPDMLIQEIWEENERLRARFRDEGIEQGEEDESGVSFFVFFLEFFGGVCW